LVNERLSAWIEELAFASLLAEASDATTVRLVVSLLETMPVEPGHHALGSARSLAQEASSLLREALAHGGDRQGNCFVEASRKIDRLLGILRGSDDRPQAVPSAGNPASTPFVSKAPAEGALRSAQPMVCDQETLELLGDFIQETSESLAHADDILVTAERSGMSLEGVNALFRVFHTIKGVAGFLDLPAIASLAHATETLLNRAREGGAPLAEQSLDLVFEATAAMRSLLDDVRKAVESGTAPSEQPSQARLIQAMDAHVERAAQGTEPPEISPPAEPGPQDTGEGRGIEANGAQGLASLDPSGSSGLVLPDEHPLDSPAVAGASPVEASKDTAGADRVERQQAFQMIPVPLPAAPRKSVAPAGPASGSAPVHAPAEQAVPADRGAAFTAASDASPATAAAPGPPAPPPPTSGAGGGPGGGAPAAMGRLRETLKVDVERVDRMVEMIGELIIVESMVVHAPEVQAIDSVRLRNYLSQLSKISRDLQDSAMRMRMVPVQGTFRKMQRMVRELSRQTGKQVVLDTSGESTEMDRSMVERIEDPLVHMIRNSIDHGIEPAEERRAAGKPVQGTIRLSAYYEGGSVVIEMADDGRGLQRDAILRKARSQGIVGDNDTLSDQEVYNLIFAPGFSTSPIVTDISGRGVGMDVVKRTIEAARGRVMPASSPGKGTTIKMVLPLTTAIIDGMLVACGTEQYVVPSLSIIESLKPSAGMLSSFAGRQELINVRGEIMPLMRLGTLFSIDDAQTDPTKALVVVVESMGRKRGLLVDDVITQQQVVIKPLGNGNGNGHAELYSGAAIMSDGRVGLILNVDRICANTVPSTTDWGRTPMEIR